MSREGAQSRIDSIKTSANNLDPYSRTALGNAVRFNTMLQLFEDTGVDSDGNRRIRNSLAGQDLRTINDNTLATALDTSVADLTQQFNNTVNPNNEDLSRTPQTELANRAFRTELGAITSNEIAFNRGRFFEANQSNSLLSQGSATYAFNSYSTSFINGDDDAFGSRTLYDNVFGDFETGEVSLSKRARSIDPEDYGATASQKVLQTLVNKNLSDSRASINKVDKEFDRFFGQSAVAAASQSGGGLVRARQILDFSIERSLELRAEESRIRTELGGTDDIDVAFNNRIQEIHKEIVSLELDRKASLDYIKEGYDSRRSRGDTSSSTVINKGGVREFVDLFNSAQDSITIQTYQFQNQTLNASLRDVLKRRVLERIRDSTKDAFQLDLVLAYPKQRTNAVASNSVDNKYNTGAVGYAINGPNLIEALSMKQMEDDLRKELHELGYASEDINNSFKVNIQFRDRKFHPKLYMTDTMAAVGTQNLTAPVGNSINQSGSNFEQMYIVHNHMSDDDALIEQQSYRNGRTEGATQSEITLKDTQLRSSLMYKQIREASKYESEFIQAQRGSSMPALQMGSRTGGYSDYNVGFAGDIYKFMTDTLDYAYEKSYGLAHGSITAAGSKNVVGNQDINMFMILDGSFMLQVGDISFNGKALIGEMGAEQPGSAFREEDPKVRKYREYQSKLADLLITNNANVVVDKKNYQEQVYDPIAKKIEASEHKKLKENFAKFGKNLGLMAGNNIFGADQEMMDRYLRAQGFTNEAGFSASDRKQIMSMGSGNIRMAKTPRQHAKSFGLVDYSDGNPELISYYLGSSNMGFYSLDAGAKTNTEMGVFFANRIKMDNLKNKVFVSSYANELEIEAAREAANRAMESSDANFGQFALTQQQEIDELRNLQDRFYHTYNQLSTNTIENRYIDNIRNAPMWQSNVNIGALQVQKARLEDLKQTLGLNDTAFKIVERMGEDGGVKSLNITLNTAYMLGSDEFTNAQSAGKKLTFEISVLNGPKDRGIINRNSPTDPRNGSSHAPGMVYFVDKNKLIGNGIFVNDSSKTVDVMGRRNYEDDFQFGSDAGRVQVETGQSAYMSSIDITTQAFGQMIGEIATQKALSDPNERYKRLSQLGMETEVLTDYLALMLTGRKQHMNKEGQMTDSVGLISQALNIVSFDSLGGDIMTKILSKESSTADIRSLLPQVAKDKNSDTQIAALKTFINSFRIAVADTETNLFGDALRNDPSSSKGLLEDPEIAQRFLDEYLMPGFQKLVRQSPELIGEILKYVDTNNYANVEQANLNDKLGMIFEPFLQSVEDTTYGGQQGYYKTLMYGLSSNRDYDTAELMNDYGDGQNLGNVRKYARLTALGYTPSTDIHKFLYRSIASGASSTAKTDPGLNSNLLRQGARQVGSAQNFDVLQSVGIGTKIDRATYVTGFGDELTVSGELRASLESQFEYKIREINSDSRLTDVEKKAAVAKERALIKTKISDIEREMKTQYADQNREFMSITYLDERGEVQKKETKDMIFFTGSAKKISQLPQRIKNALGARPLYHYGLEAQKALQSMTDPNATTRTTFSDVTKVYVNKYGGKTLKALESNIEYYTTMLKNSALNSDAEKEAKEKLDMYVMFKKDLSIKSVKDSTGQETFQADQLFKLGAIYTGKIKSVLSSDQAAYVARVTEDINELFSGPLGKDETLEEREETKQEMIRSYVLRASLDNSGLGKMIAGNDRAKYNIALLQLSGTYTDSFLANPLQGNVYANQNRYEAMKLNNNINMSELPNLINHPDIIVAGQREGYMVTQQFSTKSSMMAEHEDLKATANTREGERMLAREDDIVVSDQEGKYVQVRDGKVLRSASDKRTVFTIRGEVDNTAYGTTSSVATKSSAAYGRIGEFSIEYVFASLERDGNFANNEYLNELIKLRSKLPGSGSRVEGTDSSALIKGVASFAGQTKTHYRNNKGERVQMNTFQFLESQVLEKFEEGQVGGSLAAMLRGENRGYVFGEEGKPYTPLSSMVSGLYNANNFKSFVWSHGATILKETRGTGQIENNFMLNELLGVGSNPEDTLTKARKAASGLLISFGSSYLAGGEDDAFKAAVIQGIKGGAAGSAYQKLAGVLQITKGLTGAKADDMLFDEIITKGNADKGLYFSDTNLGGLRGLDANDLRLIMSGDPTDSKTIEASERFMKQITSMITDQAKVIGRKGYMEMSSFSQRQAALMTTAIDLMHQISANESSYTIPSDIDVKSERMKKVLTNVLGGNRFTTASDEQTLAGEKGLQDEAFEMIQGINEQINMVSLYADIAYSQSKEPVGTQTVGRHEAQHLMMPFLGDIKNFREGGQLAAAQHTFASLMSLTQNANTLMGYNTLQNKKFGTQKAWDLTSGTLDQAILSSSFNQQNFLGFYRANKVDEAKQIALKKEYKRINTLMTDGAFYNLDSATSSTGSANKEQMNQRLDSISVLNLEVEKYVDNYYALNGGIVDARIKQRKIEQIKTNIFGADGTGFDKLEVTRFLMQSQDLVVMGLDQLNNKYNANMDKAVGSDATAQFVEAMSNKEMFFTLPELDFQSQDGMVLARAKTKSSITTFLPSAQMMQSLGVQHADFIDPLVGAYKDLAELFAPASPAYNAYQKVMAAQQEGRVAVLTSRETQALQQVMQAANRMLPEAQKAIEGARGQMAFAGKTKYQGFTSTGIGSFMVPFDSVALSTAKLAEAGYTHNDKITKALQGTIEKRHIMETVKGIQVPDSLEEIDPNKVSDLGLSDFYIQNLIPGKALELTPVTRGLQDRVKNYYSLELQALSEGMSADLLSSYENMIQSSAKRKQILKEVRQTIGLDGDELREVNMLSLQEVYDTRQELKRVLREEKNLAGSDRYLYETALMDVEVDIADFESRTGLGLGMSQTADVELRTLSSKQIERRKQAVEVLSNVTTILNNTQSNTGFSNLRAPEEGIESHELFGRKYSESEQVTLGSLGQKLGITKNIHSLGAEFEDKTLRGAAQKEMALNYLSNLKEQYKSLMNDLDKLSAERDDSMSIEKRSKVEAAYAESIKAHENILRSIETAEMEVASDAFGVKGGIDRIFTTLNASLLINDQVNMMAAEVFRSPPPGSTDPRLHMSRIMNGVTALNRIAALNGAGELSESRGATGTFVTAIGTITYGGGDFDGDPYTAILNKSADTNNKVLQGKLAIKRNEILIRNLKTSIASEVNQDVIAEKQSRILEAERQLAVERSQVENNEALLKNQLKSGYENFDARARRQAAEFYGMDERLLVRGKEVSGRTDVYDDPDTGKQLRGYGNITYNADDVFTLMNTGHGLVEGLDQQGQNLFSLYDTVDKLSGRGGNKSNTTSKDALRELKDAVIAVKSARKNAADADSANGAIFKVYKNLLARHHVIDDPQNIGNDYLASILVNEDAESAEQLLKMFEGIEAEEEKYRDLKGLKDSVELDDSQSQEVMHRFIGGSLFASMNQADTFSNLMAKGAGMQVSEGGMDILLKTLGTAGGEVLGKTYNTIIGTTFKDSSLVSFAQAVMKQDEDGKNSKLKSILEKELGVRDINAESYFESLETSLGKARGVQGFMKNIHQLLRDSIKLKSDKDMVGELQKAAVTYEDLTEKLRKLDLSRGDHPDYEDLRRDLVMERDATINSMSSQLGDGPGLRALTNLNELITNAKKGEGLSVTKFSSLFMEGQSIQSPEFMSMVDRYKAEVEAEFNMITGNPEVDKAKQDRLRASMFTEAEYANLKGAQAEDTDMRTALTKLAQYQANTQMINLVAGYRMSNALTLETDVLTGFNKGYLEVGVSQDNKIRDYDEMRRDNEGQLSTEGLKNRIVDSYMMPENAIDAMDSKKAAKIRKIEALSSYLGVDVSSMYKEQGFAAAHEAYSKTLSKAADKKGLSTKDYILTFEQKYQASREQASALFGFAGEGLNEFTNLEALKTDMSNVLKSGQNKESANDSRMDKLIKVMDAETMGMMAQLAGSDKLMSQGFEVFNNLFEGVLSNTMSDELDKVDIEVLDAMKKSLGSSQKVSDNELRKSKGFKDEANKLKKRIIKRKSIQLMLGGTEGARATSLEGAEVKGITSELLTNDALLDEYIKTQEGSLTSQQAEAMSQLAEHIILKSSSSAGQYDALLDAVGGGVDLTEQEKAGLSEADQEQKLIEKRNQRRKQTEQRVLEQQSIRFESAVKQQINDRQKMADDNPYLKRGSMLSRLGSGAMGALASNKGSTTLDILAPIAITALGSAISEGAVDSTTMQELAGATATAAMYARTGFVDSANRKVYAKRMGMAQAVGAVFKYKSGLARYQGQGYQEGEKMLLAARDTIVRETVSMAINRAATPAISRAIAGSLGNNQSIAMDALTGKQHQAVQQVSGNIGASLISAAASTLISGLILKTTVPSPEKRMQADLQNFDINVATIKSVNQEIAYARAQEAAKEDIEPSENDGVPEISSYNVVTSSTYNADSAYDTISLYDQQEIEMGSDGSLNFDFS